MQVPGCDRPHSASAVCGYCDVLVSCALDKYRSSACMYICMCACTNMRDIFMYEYMYICMYECVYVCMYVCMYE